MGRAGPGLAVAFTAFVAAWGVSVVVPWAPALTVCVILGVGFAAIPWPQSIRDALQPGLSVAARQLLRFGIVLLGFQLSLGQIAGLGPLVLVLIVAIVVLSFAITLATGPGAASSRQPADSHRGRLLDLRRLRDRSDERRDQVRREGSRRPRSPSSPCAARSQSRCCPLLAIPLGLTPAQFGMWTGASVHDVGQVVATAQIAGATALAVAVVVKLTRVALLAPLVAITGLALRRTDGPRPPLVPLFLLGFLAAVVARSFLPLPADFVTAASDIQFLLLGMALFGLGAAIRVPALLRTGSRALVVAGLSWFAVAGLSLGAVWIATATGASVLG